MRVGLVVVLFVTSLVGTGEARSQDVTGYLDGNKLYEFCQPVDGFGVKPFCQAYITGVIDYVHMSDWALLKSGAQIRRSWCETYGVTIGQSVDVVIRYLQNHPEERNQPGAALVYMAMRTAFPCGGATP